MKKFSDFNIATEVNHFVGKKLSIGLLPGKKIEILDYKIEDSKFEGKGKCLWLQIRLFGEMHVVFTSAKYLTQVIEKIGKGNLPFETTIVDKNGHLEFT